MKTSIYLTILFFVQVVHAQVGIGTTTPSTNAALDVTSNDKGLLLPRVNDTSSINSPSAGLMIYNKNKNAPAVFNGTNWNTLGSGFSQNAADADSLTYMVTGPGTPGFTSAEFRAGAVQISGGVPNPGPGELTGTFSKYADINSLPLQQAFLNNTSIGTIEFFYYKQGSATPYKSIKFMTVSLISFSYGMNDNGQSGNGVNPENVIMIFNSYGFKDWINNKSFGYSLSSKTMGTY